MDAVVQLAPTVGIVAACDCLAVPRASFYRRRPVLGPSASPVADPATPAARPVPARSLSEAEPAEVLAVLHEERFQDRSPAAVQTTRWTKVSTSARSAPCTVSSSRRGSPASAAISSFIRPTKGPSYWLPRPTSFGVGTSPSCAVRSSGPTSISTSSSTSSVVTLPAG
jgi:hypothetical protein